MSVTSVFSFLTYRSTHFFSF